MFDNAERTVKATVVGALSTLTVLLVTFPLLVLHQDQKEVVPTPETFLSLGGMFFAACVWWWCLGKGCEENKKTKWFVLLFPLAMIFVFSLFCFLATITFK